MFYIHPATAGLVWHCIFSELLRDLFSPIGFVLISVSLFLVSFILVLLLYRF